MGNFIKTKEKLLNTKYPHWRNLLSSAAFLLLTTGIVSGWWYAYYTACDMACHKVILYL